MTTQQGTPQQVLQSIVDGINTGNLDALMPLYEPGAAFAAQPGNLAHGARTLRRVTRIDLREPRLTTR